jgi:hypothetical protein
MIESINGGAFLSLTGEEAYRTLDQLSDNSQQWDFSSYRDRSARIQKKGGIYEVKEDMELKMKFDALAKKVDALVIRNPSIRQTHSTWTAVPFVLAPFTQHKLVLLCQPLSSHQWNKLMLSMTLGSNPMDPSPRLTILDGETILIFLGSKINQ